MALIGAIGNEIQTLSAGFEWDAVTASPSVSTSVFHTGTRSIQISSLATGTSQWVRRQAAAAGITSWYAQFWFYIQTLPTAQNRFFIASNVTSTTAQVYLTLDNLGALRLFDEDGQITGVCQLNLSTWYCIEVHTDRTAASGSHICEARVDGAVFATASNRAISASGFHFGFGGNLNAESQTTGVWNFDDVVINDNTGTAHNGYPGGLNVGYMFPNGNGDNHLWSNTTGGAGSTTNWQLVSENPPDDSTTFIQSSSATTTIDDYTMSDSGILRGSEVTSVSVNTRHQQTTVSSNETYCTRIKKASAGTVSESAAILINSTVWTTNKTSTNTTLLPSLIKYLDPDGAPWSQVTLDSCQCGVRIFLDNSTAFDQITSLWASYTWRPQRPSRMAPLFEEAG